MFEQRHTNTFSNNLLLFCSVGLQPPFIFRETFFCCTREFWPIYTSIYTERAGVKNSENTLLSMWKHCLLKNFWCTPQEQRAEITAQAVCVFTLYTICFYYTPDQSKSLKPSYTLLTLNEPPLWVVCHILFMIFICYSGAHFHMLLSKYFHNLIKMQDMF